MSETAKMTMIGVILACALSATANAQQTWMPSCSVKTFHAGDRMAGLFPDGVQPLRASKTRTVYLCDAFYGMGSVMQVTVPKEWFAQHCTVQVARDGKTPIGARCDAVYEGAGRPAPITEAASPEKGHPHLKAMGYGAVSAGVLALCVVGGCGFLGGQ